MVETSDILLTVGTILLLGLFISGLAERTALPRVTLLLLFGILIGPHGLNLIPEFFVLRFDMVADMTLLMVGFLLGGKLTRESFANAAVSILLISLMAALLALVLVTVLLVLAGVSLPLAILLGCIASATAPAAILDVVEQTNPNSHFSRLLLAIVAVDDIWALLLFGVGMAVAGQMEGSSEVAFVHAAVVEIFGSVLLGLALGGPAAILTGRIKPGEPMLVEALGVVTVCGGLAMYFGFSYLIAAMVMGSMIANLAKHHDYPFHAIEGTEGLFMLVFFVLAGRFAGFDIAGSAWFSGQSLCSRPGWGQVFRSLAWLPTGRHRAGNPPLDGLGADAAGGCTYRPGAGGIQCVPPVSAAVAVGGDCLDGVV